MSSSDQKRRYCLQDWKRKTKTKARFLKYTYWFLCKTFSPSPPLSLCLCVCVRVCVCARISVISCEGWEWMTICSGIKFLVGRRQERCWVHRMHAKHHHQQDVTETKSKTKMRTWDHKSKHVNFMLVQISICVLIDARRIATNGPR